MRKILVWTECWATGGIETFVTAMVEGLWGRSLAQCTVFSNWGLGNRYESRLVSSGANQVVVFKEVCPNLVKRQLCGMGRFRKQLKEEKYDLVYINAMNGAGFLYAAIAKSVGKVPVIVHSHNSAFGSSHARIKQLIHSVGKKFFSSCADKKVACSINAGRYLFSDDNYIVMPNGINSKKFTYNGVTRIQTRSKLMISDDEILLGSIGRLSEAKNPLFQLEVLDSLLKRQVKCKLLLVGGGELEESVRLEAARRGLSTHVLVKGAVSDPENYMFALDVCCMPSKFEGLPFSVIECQCAGLPIVASPAIAPEADIVGLVFRPRDPESPEAWADAVVLASKNGGGHREQYAKEIERSEFSESKAIDSLQNLIADVLS